MRDYQESVTTGQTDTHTDRCRTKLSLCAAMLGRRHKIHTQTDAGQSDPYVPLCLAGDTKYTHRQTPDKVIPMCRYASHETQKLCQSLYIPLF